MSARSDERFGDALDFIEPAPRKVPGAVRRRLLFGGLAQNIVWPFFALGFVFSWLMVRGTEIWTTVEFARKTDFALGRVIAIEDHTDYEYGESEPSFAVRYAYELGGVAYEGRSWTSSAPRLDPGETVNVEFLVADPLTSRVEGLRVRGYAGPGWFVPLFPLVGLLVLLVSMLRGRRRIRMLARGRPALGKLVDKRDTGGAVNEQPIYALTFLYRDHSGREQRGETQSLNTEALEDDGQERLLYDPRRPKRIILLDELEGSMHVDERGRLVATDLGLAVMIIPLLSMAAVAATVIWGP